MLQKDSANLAYRNHYTPQTLHTAILARLELMSLSLSWNLCFRDGWE